MFAPRGDTISRQALAIGADRLIGNERDRHASTSKKQPERVRRETAART